MTGHPVLALLVASTSVVALAGHAAAQADYPNRTIRMVVPIPPGATADTMPRLIADKLREKWGQPVVIENRPGAAQNIGAELVAKAEPDGYTLLATPPGPLVINQRLYARLAFDPTAFVPVSIMGTLPNVLVAKNAAPFKTFPEMIAHAKANPDTLNYGSAGTGSTPQLLMAWTMSLTGIRIKHVPYQGSAPALNDLLAGHIDLMYDNLGNPLQLIKEGKVRVLGVGSTKRLAELPDAPMLSETVPGLAASTFFTIVAPPKTPQPIVTKLSAAVAEIIATPFIKERFVKMVATPVGNTPAQAAAFIKSETELWAKIITAAGLKPQ